METNLFFYTATIYKWYNLLAKDDTKQIVISSLRYLVREKRITVYAFVIMPNHIHTIAAISMEDEQTKESPFAALLKFTGHAFKKYLKNYPAALAKFEVKSKDRNYRFWQDRSKYIELFSRDVIMQKMAYIHNNPLQEKWSMAEFPEDYEYSSARFYETGIDKFGFLEHIAEGNYW
jgi:putative transposase